MGPNTKGGYNYVSIDSTTKPENFKMYLADNKFVDNNNKDYKTLSSNNWSGITYASSTGRNESNVKSTTPFQIISNGTDISVVNKAESAESAYDNVLKYSGAGINSESRTAIDKQVMNETKNGTGQLVGAFPSGTVTTSPRKNSTSNTNSNTNANSTINYSIN